MISAFSFPNQGFLTHVVRYLLIFFPSMLQSSKRTYPTFDFLQEEIMTILRPLVLDQKTNFPIRKHRFWHLFQECLNCRVRQLFRLVLPKWPLEIISRNEPGTLDLKVNEAFLMFLPLKSFVNSQLRKIWWLFSLRSFPYITPNFR